MVGFLAAAAFTLLSLPGVKVSIAVVECGHQNAFYNPQEKQVLLCVENKTLSPEVFRFLLAHEMGHAVIHQLQLPITGSEEAAADEFAAVAMAEAGHAADLAKVAKWFEETKSPENVYDDHQSGAKRAAVLSCLSWGAQKLPFAKGCTAEYDRASSNWWRLVTKFGV